jgi:hypothetical protein
MTAATALAPFSSADHRPSPRHSGKRHRPLRKALWRFAWARSDIRHVHTPSSSLRAYIPPFPFFLLFLFFFVLDDFSKRAFVLFFRVSRRHQYHNRELGQQLFFLLLLPTSVMAGTSKGGNIDCIYSWDGSITGGFFFFCGFSPFTYFLERGTAAMHPTRSG